MMQSHQDEERKQADTLDPSKPSQPGQGKKFMSLAALPVPKFLQERKARENQYQKMLDDDDEDGDFGYY